ncbi:MAG: hypothetical protein AVDCRST_MAG50-1804 [uncultured Acidimicrobiales bacterium]|uniref:Activator of Hsp90 ATPase homologue 1/2-like C-terminal domain-containing protein n=1 Tax=uncultured Acidimicrobiales bacterium TaxID=310071 RepID=A0A6J4I8B5_9ACTN|nr:MAG: hypothetical protein AVDCRST_MAG50-1804 [uncultured Acidimicrobiales bacterium]
MTDERSIDLSVEVPGTPEEVWEAIASGPGITSWFVPCELEGRPGGKVTHFFGSFGSDDSEVSVWEPPHRFEHRSGGERPLAYEWLVEARDGGTCVVRLVNSGFGPGEDWDADYNGMAQGWQIFLQHLRLHLTHHRGEHAHAATPTVTIPGPNRAAFSALCAAVGVPDDLVAGDPIRTSGDGPRLSGRVDSVLATPAATTYLLVLDEPAPGTAFLSVEGDGEEVGGSLYLYLYGEGAQRADEWTEHLTSRFPAMTETLPAEAYPSS